ncbi:MAG: peptide chain release factor N(5)-glutamine methyltransferase [Acidobacteriales bacterium]|nr:peptide chain release factor N(5)-glutamine methyltransferase [Terriglobales bacterium]
MDLRSALTRATERLAQEPVGPPRMAAETLLMHVLGCERAYLHAHSERELSAEEGARYDAVVTERASGKPLQYITGHQEFRGLDFKVSPAVLIPRPETEHLVEEALERLHKSGLTRPRIVDVGTGSGCVILALASELKDAELHATEISAEALSVASQNAEHLGLSGHVQFHQADLLACFTENSTFDLVVSNPPYVGLDERDKVQREVREHEPHVAVFAGEHGFDIYRRLIPEAARVLRPGGWLLMEIGYSISGPVEELLIGWEDVHFVPDLQGIPRVVVVKKPA